MDNKVYMTCVYTISDQEAFEPEKKRIFEHFQKLGGRPWAITAISMGDEIHRLRLAEEAHNNNRDDLLDNIFSIVDPSKINSISELDDFTSLERSASDDWEAGARSMQAPSQTSAPEENSGIFSID